MYRRLDRAHRVLPALFGAVSLVLAVALLVWDARPEIYPVGSHEFLGAISLAMIALAYIAYQVVHRPSFKEFVKAVLLAIAFLFWAANQLWPNSHFATLCNDIAISLFVADAFLVIIGWPASPSDSLFAENCACCREAGIAEPGDCRCANLRRSS